MPLHIPLGEALAQVHIEIEYYQQSAAPLAKQSIEIREMIKDPIRLTTIESWKVLCEQNEGNQIFFRSVTGGVLTLAEVYPKSLWYLKESPSIRKIWSCCNKGSLDRYMLGERDKVSKEVFVKYLGQNFPDYMDWMLFNLEWLQ